MAVRDSTQPLASLFSRAASEATYLIQTELRLARTEISDKLNKVASGGVHVGAGAILALAGLIILLLAIVRWLEVAGVPSVTRLMPELPDGVVYLEALRPRVEGQVLIDNANIYGPGVDVVQLRRRVGMVFQKSNPFPKSIFENVSYGLRINGMVSSKSELAGQVEASLRQAALWDEVKDRLQESALALSGGQQQRLCIARALAVRPDILLMDEPASALDPIATQRIEELVYDLKKKYTVVIVTHNMQQAARVSDFTAFFWLGRLVEYDRTEKIFTNPTEKLTEDYVTGRFG